MITEIQEDENGELFFQIPLEYMEELGWEIGDTLKWSVEDTGAIILSKQD